MVILSTTWKVLYGWMFILLVLMWPLVKWVLSLLTFYHFLRMIYHWNNPDVNGWIGFVGFFVLLTILTTVVSKRPHSR